MKILIPFSGGVNSTYIAEKWLRETDHEIIALYTDDGEKQTKATQNIYSWLKDNRRDFTLIEPILVPKVSDIRPIRKGFTNLRDRGRINSIHQTIIYAAKNLNVDGVVFGLSLENSWSNGLELVFTGNWENLDCDLYLAGMRDWQKPVTQNCEDRYNGMMGRFEQYEALPGALRSLVYRCGCGDFDKCINCGYWDAYEHSGMTGREFDLLMAEKTCAGPWRHLADPKIYMWRNNIGRILMEMREER